MKILSSVRLLNRHERILWIVSVIVVTLSFLLVPERDYLTLAASLIGVTALIFVAKGLVIGQVLTVIFAVFYGIISFYFRYYGEMITYLCMSSPMAILAVISWYRHPYRDSAEVEVSRVTGRQIVWMWTMAILVTVGFWFILKALGNANLLFSTLSVTTSFIASWLTYLRSPYYALAYAANDIVLIVLWILAAMADVSYLPMIVCFAMFLLNDLYGFVNWRSMRKRQWEESVK